MSWYLSGSASVSEAYDNTIGVILTVRAKKFGIVGRMKRGVPWCLDNGVYTGAYTKQAWLDAMGFLDEYKDTCLFAVVPDSVGNAAKTLAMFAELHQHVSEYPKAFVSQDGMRPNDPPWDDFECLFIGGTDEHKLGREGGAMIAEAQRRGKYVHVGRVNSPERIMKFWNADSWDGNHLSFEPSNAGKIAAAVNLTRAMKRSSQLWDT